MPDVTLSYPDTDRDDTADVLHGRQVPDPYRYLEDPDSPRTAAFVRAQNALSEPYLAALPGRDAFGAMTAALLSAPRTGVPSERGRRYFVTANPGGLDQDQLLVADTLDELIQRPRVLLDPNLLSTDGTVALTAAAVNDDGTLLAYAISEAGSDWRTIRVRRVAGGADLPDTLRWTKWVDPTWLPDGASLLYWRYPAPVGGEYTEAMGAGELVLHRLGSDQAADEVVWVPPGRDWMAEPFVAEDGNLLVLTTAPGTDSRSTVQAHRITTRGGASQIDPAPITIVGALADANRVAGCAGDTIYLRTERDAPRGRLVAVDVSAAPTEFTDVIAEDPADVLVSAHVAAGALLVVWSADAAHRIQLRDRDGGSPRPVDLPGPMSVTTVNTRPSSREIFLGITSFTRPARSYRIDAVDTRTTEAPNATELPFPAGPALPGVTSTRARARSADGTGVPMTVLRRADAPPGPAPTLLYGYGGFDIPVLPSFSAMFAAWVAAGGALAVANLRGGGEFGGDWHTAGMGEHKQRVFDDFIGCAEHLIASGMTTPRQLAVHGRSNGGLLVGAVMTQRPELFAAALPTVGVLDMLRFHLFTIGWAWTSEYGTPDDPADFAVLAGYSPLHALREGVAYPPTLITTGDHDDRVVPAHSLKFGAALQHCQAGPGPVLLRIDTRAGHGMGKPITALAAEYADQLAFAAEHTGLTPRT